MFIIEGGAFVYNEKDILRGRMNEDHVYHHTFGRGTPETRIIGVHHTEERREVAP